MEVLTLGGLTAVEEETADCGDLSCAWTIRRKHVSRFCHVQVVIVIANSPVPGTTRGRWEANDHIVVFVIRRMYYNMASPDTPIQTESAGVPAPPCTAA